MDVLASECSSGCESGWTLYLEQSFLSNDAKGSADFLHRRKDASGGCEEVADEDEEDMSMVSDASSGPAQFHDDEGYPGYGDRNSYPEFTCAFHGGEEEKIGRDKRRRRNDVEDLPSFLDDTASSPAFDSSKIVIKEPLASSLVLSGSMLDMGLLSSSNSQSNNGVGYHQASVQRNLEFAHGYSSSYLEMSPYQNTLWYIQPSYSGNNLQNHH